MDNASHRGLIGWTRKRDRRRGRRAHCHWTSGKPDLDALTRTSVP